MVWWYGLVLRWHGGVQRFGGAAWLYGGLWWYVLIRVGIGFKSKAGAAFKARAWIGLGLDRDGLHENSCIGRQCEGRLCHADTAPTRRVEGLDDVCTGASHIGRCGCHRQLEKRTILRQAESHGDEAILTGTCAKEV